MLRLPTLCLAAFALAPAAALAQAQTDILHHTFADDTGGWTAFGQTATVATTKSAPSVPGGKGALKFDYKVARGEVNAAIAPTPIGTLAKAKAFRLWVRPDYSAVLALAVQEQGGGRYLAIFRAPKDQWQKVELAPDDFVLSDGANDPKDANGRLDLDQVEGIAIADVAQLLAQAENDEIAKLFGLTPGSHTLYVSDFTVSSEALPSAYPSTGGELRIDSFAHPQIGWLATAGIRLSLTKTPGLQADYRQTKTALLGMMRPVGRAVLAGKTTLAFTIASAKEAQIVVQLEERDGGKYNTVITVPAGSAPQQVSLPFSQMKPADDSRDANTTLDPDQIKQVVLIDLTGIVGQGDEQDNTLTVSSLRAK